MEVASFGPCARVASLSYPDLDTTQAAILDWLVQYINCEGIQPSIVALASKFKISTDEALRQINLLDEKGYLWRYDQRMPIRLNYDKLPGPFIRIDEGKVCVIGMPVRMTPEWATEIVQAILAAAETQTWLAAGSGKGGEAAGPAPTEGG